MVQFKTLKGTQHFYSKFLCSKTKVTISQLIQALTHLHNSVLIERTIPTVLLGNFNIDLMEANTAQKEQKTLMKYLVTDKGNTQLMNQYTTDYRTQIDHVPQIKCTINRLSSAHLYKFQ